MLLDTCVSVLELWATWWFPILDSNNWGDWKLTNHLPTAKCDTCSCYLHVSLSRTVSFVYLCTSSLLIQGNQIFSRLDFEEISCFSFSTPFFLSFSFFAPHLSFLLFGAGGESNNPAIAWKNQSGGKRVARRYFLVL